MADNPLSKSNIPIRLTDERWEHIAEQHPEVSNSRKLVLDTIENPERILEGNDGELLAVKTVETGKWLVVVYRETDNDGFIITAFFTRRARSLSKRVVTWSPSSNS
jgi:hypothetical protein